MSAAPGQQVEFDAAAGEIIEHLIGRDVAAVRNGRQFLHVVDVEIGDAPGTDLAGLLQLFESGDGLGERIAAPPVQKVKIDAVDAEIAQAAFAGGNRTRPAGVGGQHLADDECLVAPTLDRFSHDTFGSAVAVHLCSVDQRHAEIEPGLQAADFVGGLRAVFTHPPCPLAERGNLAAVRKSDGRDRIVHGGLS